jgi:acyl transferase domain-containing protein/NAD(P)-dependent dehydrogenase (short-subunit alcohol dehydrogenase family)
MQEAVPIAVVGLACRFPGAKNAEEFWDNILRDVDAVQKLPLSRFHRARYYDPKIGSYGKSYSDRGGLIDDHPFEAAEFGLSPKVVESTDIAHLWSLEVARDAFLDAGLDRSALAGKNASVVLGHARGSMLTADMAYATAVEGLLDSIDDTFLSPASKQQVIERVHASYPRRTEDGGIGTMTSGLAGLISHTFKLTGRHMVVDAACASSFAALDITMRALQRGRIDLALTGGASYSQELSVIMFAQSRALSPDGSYPFDRRANGFISSDGIGFFVLKRLDDALRDGDRIRAVIRGVGGSCDGKGRALWAPRKEGQILAMKRALESSRVDPRTIDLIEAHATSTPLGDRTELEAIEACFGEAVNARGRKILIGSVKGNIGHTREAAGAAGLTKAILAIEKRVLPPTGNFREPSPEIPWADLSCEVSTKARAWDAHDVRRAGVSAFGIGGLNYHVIVEEARASERRRSSKAKPTSGPLDVAIVGVGGVFPGAKTADEFWANLAARKDVMCEVPVARWKKEIYHQAGDRAPYRTYSKRGAFVEGFAANWRRYKVPPKLVERNDPLQFMLLESALDALEDAKIDLEKIDRGRVAVIMGSVFGSDFALELSLAIRSEELAETIAEFAPGKAAGALERLRARLPEINEDSSGSFSSSTLASRTSKTLDLMGPAYAIDAACASSLASLEAACELLATGAVDLAIYGGGDRAMRVQRYEGYCQFFALSKTDCARPFDARADGFLPGEGAAVLVLKRLEDAKKDGDRIYAVVKGIGSSGDSEKKSMHRASARGLAQAIDRALDEAAIDPSTIGFVECHGAGTPVGDRVEAEALATAYGTKSRKTPLVLGSVKSNLGHTQGAAGAMAILKTALALDRGEVPPTAAFESPHPEHHFEHGLRVNAKVEPFPSVGPVRRAGVSSMGLAGINYHVVLEAPSPTQPADALRVEGAALAGMTADPRFASFWARVQPSIAGFVERLWSSELIKHGAPCAPCFNKSDPNQATTLHLRGTAHQIGRAHGEAMRAEIREVMERYEAFLGEHGIQMLALPKAIDRFLDRFDRATKHELEGIAEGAGVPFRHLFAYNLDAALFPAYTSGCTQAVRLAAHNGGTLIHLANEDSPLLLHLGGYHPRVIQIRTRTDAPDPERTTVLFSVAGQCAGPNGANDVGLTVTSTTLLDGDPRRNVAVEGLPHPQLVKRILEEARTIDDARAIVHALPRIGRWSLLVSDADRDRATYLEYDGDAILKEERIADMCVTTNHALSGPSKGAEAPEHSRLRQRRACEVLDEGPRLDVDAAKRLLRDRFDLGRKREVQHPTMNTVRRVDNVMSLVVEPRARTLHVTDRIVPPAANAIDAAQFIAIPYGHPPKENVEALTAEGAGLAEVDEVMERLVIRAVDAPAPKPGGSRRTPACLLISGTGPRTERIAAAFRARGTRVTIARDATEALDRLAALGGAKQVDALGIVLDQARGQPWSLDQSTWRTCRNASLDAPFRLLRAWAPERTDGLVFGVTRLGGALGFDNVPDGDPLGGGLIGLLKALRREGTGRIQFQILDTSALESPEKVEAALLREIDAGSPILEVGLCRGKRQRLAMAPTLAFGSSGPARLPRTWLVTGGARGVTARMALRLAKLYRPVLHLVGKHPLPSDDAVAHLLALDGEALESHKRALLERHKTPLAWRAACDTIDKTREIASTLRAISTTGAEVHYHAADVADREALRATLDAIRARTPIEGLIHGAGVEYAKPFNKKSDEIFHATVSAKVDGIVHLLHLLAGDPLTHVVGFSSVSGRFGGHGQADYALANEALARILASHRAERPERKVFSVSWPAFSEVGLAARSSAKTFLEQAGQRFMTPDEGANHLIRELWAGAPESEVTIAEPNTIAVLDLDRSAPSPKSRADFDEIARRAETALLSGRPILVQGSNIVLERTLDAKEPFLDQHRLDGVPILPAVMAHAMLHSAANVGGGEWSIADLEIRTPLKVAEGTGRRVRIALSEDRIELTATATKPNGTVLEPNRLHVVAKRVPFSSQTARTALEALLDRCRTEIETPAVHYPYADGPGAKSIGIYHGPAFRCLLGVVIGKDGGRATIAVPEMPGLFFDGCLQAAGLLARAIFEKTALPRAFGRVLEIASPKPRAERIVHVRFRGERAGRITSDFVVTEGGVPVFGVEAYEAEVAPER